MSLETIFGSKALSALKDQLIPNDVVVAIQSLTREIIALRESLPEPFVALKSTNDNLSSNVADGVVIMEGPPVKPGSRLQVEDFNVNYTTTAGTVRIVILDQHKNIVIDVLRDINNSLNGTGRFVLEQEERLAVVGQTAGAGTFSAYCSGTIKKV